MPRLTLAFVEANKVRVHHGDREGLAKGDGRIGGRDGNVGHRLDLGLRQGLSRRNNTNTIEVHAHDGAGVECWQQVGYDSGIGEVSLNRLDLNRVGGGVGCVRGSADKGDERKGDDERGDHFVRNSKLSLQKRACWA